MMITQIIKKIGFIFCMALYLLLIPFFFVNCQFEDTPYIVVSDDPDLSTNLLEQCQKDEFLSAECIDVLVAENQRKNDEKAAIATGVTVATQIEDCTDVLADPEDDTIAKCITADDATDFIDAIEACEETTVTEYTKDCATINNASQSAEDLCGETQEDTRLELEFCDPFLEYILEPSNDDILTEE